MAALKQTRAPSTSIAAIINHKVRSRCWHVLTDREASPAELAREFGIDVSDCAYHFRVLVDMDLIEKVGERRVGSVIEKRYKAIKRPQLEEGDLEDIGKAGALNNGRLVAQMCFADLSASLDTGKLVERPEHAALRMPLLLDQEGWEKVAQASKDLLDVWYEAQAESAERRVNDPERETIKATAFSFLFETP